jgi:hypothetical protein
MKNTVSLGLTTHHILLHAPARAHQQNPAIHYTITEISFFEIFT